MKISVVITAYNEEAYLPRCLRALVASDYPKENFEIIVVDNNSTDKTAQIAKSFAAKVIGEKQQGYVFGLNTGMRAANNEIIAVTDADTAVSKNWLSEITSTFTDERVVAVTGGSNNLSSIPAVNFLMTSFFTLFLRTVFALGLPHLSGFNFAVRKEAFLKVGGLDLRFKMAPDVDLGIRLVKIGRVVYNPKMLVATSPRRWRDDPLKAVNEYVKGFVGAVILRRPPNVKQKVIR